MSEGKISAVYYGAKILILMQFTTAHRQTASTTCCLLWCKDTNFNAIHNYATEEKPRSKAVYYGAKILILMQFTTTMSKWLQIAKLFIMVQRY